jgi:hypothetical protein
MSGRVISTRRATDSSSTEVSEDGGGNVECILKRLGNVETTVSELKSQVSAILAVVPHLATRADVMDVRAYVATVETTIIKWIVATTLATGGLAFTIAKFVH